MFVSDGIWPRALLPSRTQARDRYLPCASAARLRVRVASPESPLLPVSVLFIFLLFCCCSSYLLPLLLATSLAATIAAAAF